MAHLAHSTFELSAKMNRYCVLVFVSFCLLSNTMALRGALFRSGRSLFHRQNLPATSAYQPQFLASEKRSPVVELYPVVDSGNPVPEVYQSYFRI
uniref:Uncharacterized protein n=1 Tax=Caenorhabditis japonica TaxID=281687 RepID=A0A8R1I3W2_CAEJA